MPLTLLEASKVAMGRDDSYGATVIEMFARSSDLLNVLPFDDIPGNAYKALVEKTLPTVEERGVNEEYTEDTGETDEIVDTLTISGGDIDVDKFIVKTGGSSQRAVQEGMKIKALALRLTKQIVKGDSISNKKTFDGLQARITLASQIINNSTSASGAGLSLIKLDELIDAVDMPTHLVMTKDMRRILTQAARTYTVGGFITYVPDSFGRRQTVYNELPILIVDKDETNTAIMPWTEAAYSGSSITQSLYCISVEADGVLMLQNGGMQVSDLGEIDTKPVYRTRIEWYTTLSHRRPYSLGRLRYIQNTTATA